MSINILMPALSPTMTAGNLVKWHKKEGDVIKSGDLLAEIETDKATMEVEAVDAGILGKIIVAEGTEDVLVNAVIAVILEKGEQPGDIKVTDTSTGPDSSSADTKPACKSAIIKDPLDVVRNPQEYQINQDDTLQVVKPVGNAESAHNHSPSLISPSKSSQNNSQRTSTSQKATSSSQTGRIIASPLAKKLAAIHNVDLGQLSGTGPKNRIVKLDVMENLDCVVQSDIRASNDDAVSKSRTVPEQSVRDQKLSMMRKVIAARLVESKQTIPHFYLTVDCQLDQLIKARTEINQQYPQEKKISINDFIIKAMAAAMHDVPEVNAEWGGDHIKYYNRIDIAVAVAIDGGLVTPIIVDAHHKTLSAISAEMKSLAKRARENKLKPAEFQGGTITLSNLGMYGIKSFSAIINPPQACILAVGIATKQPVIEDDQIKIKTIMTCTLSVDHRVIDGAIGSRYLKAIQSYLESPIKLFYR